MIDQDTITSVTRTIVERFHPKRIVFFDSYARRGAGQDSDLDLFIEMETSRRSPERAIKIASAPAFIPDPWTSSSIRLRK